MKTAREGRPAVISATMALKLQDYLGFRHVVRSLYGYELDPERLEKLVNHYPEAWQQFEREMQEFIAWLRALASSLDT